MWFFVGIALAILTFFTIDSYLRRRFEKEWPSIDEDEFFRRCSPGTNRQTALKTRKIIAEQLGVPYDQVYPEQRFVEDLGCD